MEGKRSKPPTSIHETGGNPLPSSRPSCSSWSHYFCEMVLAGDGARHERNHRNSTHKAPRPKGGAENSARLSRHLRGAFHLFSGSGGCARASLHHRLISDGASGARIHPADFSSSARIAAKRSFTESYFTGALRVCVARRLLVRRTNVHNHDNTNRGIDPECDGIIADDLDLPLPERSILVGEVSPDVRMLSQAVDEIHDLPAWNAAPGTESSSPACM